MRRGQRCVDEAFLYQSSRVARASLFLPSGRRRGLMNMTIPFSLLRSRGEINEEKREQTGFPAEATKGESSLSPR